MDVKAGIDLMKAAELVEKDALQRGFVGADKHCPALHPCVAGQLRLSQLQLLVGRSHMGKQLFPLCGKHNSPV